MGQWIHEYGPTVGMILGFLAQTLILHGKRSGDLATLAEWKERHDTEARTRDEGIAQLRVIAAASQATADSMKTQLAIVQQELRDNRMHQRERS